MRFVTDTVGVIRAFTNKGHIGAAAIKIFNETDLNQHEIIIPAFALVEIMYLSERSRIGINLDETLEKIYSSKNYSIINLNAEIIRKAGFIKDLELHDRLIVATASQLNLPLITCDQKIIDSKIVQTIWN